FRNGKPSHRFCQFERPPLRRSLHRLVPWHHCWLRGTRRNPVRKSVDDHDARRRQEEQKDGQNSPHRDTAGNLATDHRLFLSDVSERESRSLKNKQQTVTVRAMTVREPRSLI